MSTDNQQQLAALRSQIDGVDTELVQLLAKRRELTTRIGDIKQQLGEPLYVPSREAALIEARREQASALQLNPDLIEDVLRRLIRESYRNQEHRSAKQFGDASRPIIIVGGAGQLGQLFVRLFQTSGYQVQVVDKTSSEAIAWQQAQLVLVSVPIAVTESVIANLPILADDCVLADVTSIKAAPLAAMLKQHGGPVVGLHPMFGPQVPNLAKQLVVVCAGRKAEQYGWLLQQLENWGAVLQAVPAVEHDERMAFVQVLRHLSTFVYGDHLAQEGIKIDELLSVSSPIYRLELMMVGRLFAQNASLYADIILANPTNLAMVSRYLKQFQQVLKGLQAGDREGFIKRFEALQQFFGHHGQQFLRESQQLLQTADDLRQPTLQQRL